MLITEDGLRRLRDCLREDQTFDHELLDGHLLVDRRLPFLCVYRQPPGRPDPETERLVGTQAAHLVAPAALKRQDEVAALVEVVADEAARALGGFLVVELWGAPMTGAGDEHEPQALRPAFRIEVPEGDTLAGPVEAFAKALKRITVQGQAADVTVDCAEAPAPPALPSLLPRGAGDGRYLIGLEVAPVYRDRDTGEVFPFLFEALRRQLAGALKTLFHRFACAQTSFHPPHPLALGRRGVEEVALEVDRRLAEIDGSFDFLLQVTPVNADAAWEAFEAGGCREDPTFLYRPMPVDPELLKRDLFALPIERVQDPTLGWLFREKQEELDRKVTMLRDRETRQFFFESLQLFGEVEHGLLKLAREILERLPVHDYSYESDGYLDAEAFAQAALEEFVYYRRQCPGFPERAQIRADLPAGLMVSRGRLLIGKASRTPMPRVDALLQHEVGTHMLTYFNGQAQPFRLLYRGLAGYEALQEGLAVLAEYLVGGLNIPRLRVLAARVVAAQHLIEGTSFVELFRYLTDTYGFNRHVAWTISMRTFRGGGLMKDVIYLRGLYRLMEHLRSGGELEPLFVGKIALHHLPAIEELAYREVLKPVPLRPRYLAAEHAAERLERVYAGLTFVDLVA